VFPDPTLITFWRASALCVWIEQSLYVLLYNPYAPLPLSDTSLTSSPLLYNTQMTTLLSYETLPNAKQRYIDRSLRISILQGHTANRTIIFFYSHYFSFSQISVVWSCAYVDDEQQHHCGPTTANLIHHPVTHHPYQN